MKHRPCTDLKSVATVQLVCHQLRHCNGLSIYPFHLISLMALTRCLIQLSSPPRYFAVRHSPCFPTQTPHPKPPPRWPHSHVPHVTCTYSLLSLAINLLISTPSVMALSSISLMKLLHVQLSACVARHRLTVSVWNTVFFSKQKVVTECVSFLLHVWNIPGSNLDPETSYPACVFCCYNWINQLSKTSIWWLDICCLLHRYQLHVSALMASFRFTTVIFALHHRQLEDSTTPQTQRQKTKKLILNVLQQINKYNNKHLDQCSYRNYNIQWIQSQI